jgi:hypothetical protein
MKLLLNFVRIFHCIFALFLSIPSPYTIQHQLIVITIISQLTFNKCLISKLEKKLNNNKRVNFLYEWTYPYHRLNHNIFFKLVACYLVCILFIGKFYLKKKYYMLY